MKLPSKVGYFSKLRKFCPTGLTANSFWKFGHSTISMYLGVGVNIYLKFVQNKFQINDEAGGKEVREKCRRLLWPVPN